MIRVILHSHIALLVSAKRNLSLKAGSECAGKEGSAIKRMRPLVNAHGERPGQVSYENDIIDGDAAEISLYIHGSSSSSDVAGAHVLLWVLPRERPFSNT